MIWQGFKERKERWKKRERGREQGRKSVLSPVKEFNTIEVRWKKIMEANLNYFFRQLWKEIQSRALNKALTQTLDNFIPPNDISSTISAPVRTVFYAASFPSILCGHPLWKSMWRVLKKREKSLEVPFNLASPLLGIFPKELKALCPCDIMHTYVYSGTAWKQPKYLSINKWIKKMCCPINIILGILDTTLYRAIFIPFKQCQMFYLPFSKFHLYLPYS